MIPIEALRSKEGAAYLGGAALSFLLAAVLFAGGVERFLQEDALREAVRAYHRDDPTTRALLLDLKESRPEDASVLVLLGCYEVEHADDADRLSVAERLFEEARLRDPSRASATLGVAVAQLRLAAMQAKDRRAKEATAVAEMLDRAGLDRDDPDYVATLAGAELLRGRPEQALKLLSAEPRGVPSRAGQLAWRWNEATAAVLCRDGGALEAALAAYVLRRLPMPIEGSNADPAAPPADAARLLTAAYRVALADPGAKPATTEALAERATLAQAAVSVRPTGGGPLRGRFLPPGKDEAAVLNAVGLALTRLERWEEAAAMFDQAARAHPEEPLYLLNQAEGLRRQAATIDEINVKERRSALHQAGEAYRRLLEVMAKKEGREETRALAATNGAAVFLEAGEPRAALSLYRQHGEPLMPAAQVHRDIGALQDHANNGACVDAYRKAVSLNHPESQALERRIRVRSRR